MMGRQYISFYRYDEEASQKMGYECYKHVLIDRNDFIAACEQMGYSKSEDVVFCYECKHYYCELYSAEFAHFFLSKHFCLHKIKV